MSRSGQDNKTYSLNVDGNNIFVWLLQSSVVVALVTALLYAFGANFEYRLRWEFGMQNVQFVRTTSDITYDGLIVVSAWFKTAQPYLLAAFGATCLLLLYSRFLKALSAVTKRTLRISVVLLLVAVSGLVINRFLQVRAAWIASRIRERAATGPHTLVTTGGRSLEGYVVVSSEERTAFLTRTGAIVIVDAKDIESVTLPAR